MSDRHWAYDAADAESQGEAPTFDLFGETFECMHRLPARSLRLLAEAAQAIALVDQVEAYRLFILGCLAHPQDDTARLDALIENEPRLSFDALVSLATWLMQTLTGRPIPPSVDLPTSPSSDGPTSKLVSLSPATPSEPLVSAPA